MNEPIISKLSLKRLTERKVPIVLRPVAKVITLKRLTHTVKKRQEIPKGSKLTPRSLGIKEEQKDKMRLRRAPLTRSHTRGLGSKLVKPKTNLTTKELYL